MAKLIKVESFFPSFSFQAFFSMRSGKWNSKRAQRLTKRTKRKIQLKKCLLSIRIRMIIYYTQPAATNKKQQKEIFSRLSALLLLILFFSFQLYFVFSHSARLRSTPAFIY